MLNLLDLTKQELEELLDSWGEPAYRAGQLFGWLHKKRAGAFGEMGNLPKSLREKLVDSCTVGRLNLEKRLVSTIDGTVKYLYGLADGAKVESVRMGYRHGNSLCISTQVGCRMGCTFCASTLGGLVRHLSPGEMLAQVYEAARDLPVGDLPVGDLPAGDLPQGGKIGSIVLMGIGEPLDNFENVCKFLELLSHPEGFGLSLRHVSLSTCGLVEGIRRLAAKRYPLTLSVSLHATDDATRSRLMPVNRKDNIAALLGACRDYFSATGRRVSFEYALIAGQNDSLQQARKLAALLRGMNCHVNLIPHNPVKERDYARPSPEKIKAFRQELERLGITATLRRELGADVMAACGQLRREQSGR